MAARQRLDCFPYPVHKLAFGQSEKAIGFCRKTFSTVRFKNFLDFSPRNRDDQSKRFRASIQPGEIMKKLLLASAGVLALGIGAAFAGGNELAYFKLQELPILSAASVDSANDYVPVYDASAGKVKRVPASTIGTLSGLTATAAELNRLDRSAKVSWMDEFLGDVIADQWTGLVGSDPQSVTPTVNNSTSTGLNGILRLTAGDDAAASMAVNGSQVSSFRQFVASTGGLVFEARVALTSVANVAMFCGFTDVSTIEMPANSAGSADTITTNASDGVGFMFDTAMTTDNFWLVGVAADTDATAQNSGTAPTFNTFYDLRIEVTSAGAATFYINGSQVGTTMTGAVTAATALTPTCAIYSTTTATKSLDIDYLFIEKNRV